VVKSCCQNSQQGFLFTQRRDGAVKFATMTCFSLKSTPMNSDLKYGDKTIFFLFVPFRSPHLLIGSPGTYEDSKNSQKFPLIQKGTGNRLSVTLFNLALLVRSRRSLKLPPWFLKICVTVDSKFTKQGIEKLTTPIDSKWPHYPEIDDPLNLEKVYFFQKFPQRLND
jgi:hypothetical protein